MWLKNNSTTWAFVTVVIGLVVPWWPLCVLGVLIAALGGQWALAVLFGLGLDLLWGRPTGVLTNAAFPMTLLAVIASCLRVLSLRYMLSKMPDRL